jgi:hypothetical protein
MFHAIRKSAVGKEVRYASGTLKTCAHLNKPFSIPLRPLPSRPQSLGSQTTGGCTASHHPYASPGGPFVRQLQRTAGAVFSLFRKSAHGALLTFPQKCTVCTFAFLTFPLAILAADLDPSIPPSRGQIISLDVAAGGTLAAVCTALVMWLTSQRNERKRSECERVKIDRTPPLGEDVARTYATKADLIALDTKVSSDISSLRASIADNDRRAEDRARGTHSRIDALYKEQQKVNRSLGMLTGVLIGGKCSASVATSFAETDN